MADTTTTTTTSELSSTSTLDITIANPTQTGLKRARVITISKKEPTHKFLPSDDDTAPAAKRQRVNYSHSSTTSVPSQSPLSTTTIRKPLALLRKSGDYYTMVDQQASVKDPRGYQRRYRTIIVLDRSITSPTEVIIELETAIDQCPELQSLPQLALLPCDATARKHWGVDSLKQLTEHPFFSAEGLPVCCWGQMRTDCLSTADSQRVAASLLRYAYLDVFERSSDDFPLEDVIAELEHEGEGALFDVVEGKFGLPLDSDAVPHHDERLNELQRNDLHMLMQEAVSLFWRLPVSATICKLLQECNIVLPLGFLVLQCLNNTGPLNSNGFYFKPLAYTERCLPEFLDQYGTFPYSVDDPTIIATPLHYKAAYVPAYILAIDNTPGTVRWPKMRPNTLYSRGPQYCYSPVTKKHDALIAGRGHWSYIPQKELVAVVKPIKVHSQGKGDEKPTL